MFGFMHLFASSIYIVCGLSLVLGVVVFIRNVIRRGDVDYEARFPWWVRLSLYLVVFVIPPVGWLNGEWLNAPWWVHLLLYLVAFAIPPVGLLGSLYGWVLSERLANESNWRKACYLFHLSLLVFLIGTSFDPAARVTNCTSVF